MANPHRGQVVLHAGDKALILSFSINALCELEEQLGMPVAKIAAGLNDPDNVRLSTVRALVWSGLRDHQKDATISFAGDVISEAGIPAVMEAIGKAFQLAFPEVENAQANPKKGTST